MKQTSDGQAKKSAARRLPRRAVRQAKPRPTLDQLLQQSQVFDIAQDAIFLWREPGGIEFWNKGATDLYGYREAEVLGRPPADFLKTGPPVSWREIRKQLRDSGAWNGQFRHRTQDGRTVLVSSRLKTLPSEDGTLLVLESNRDVTEMERRLREQAVAARFSLDALQATSIQTICDDATHILAREMGADFSSLFELEPDGKSMRLRSGVGWRPDSVGVIQLDVGEQTPIGRALQLNQPIIIEDVRTDRHLRLPRFMSEHKVASSMAVVIQGRVRAFGVLSVDTTAPRAFTAEDVHFLEAIGNILATAISRIQFEHELRDTGGRLRAIVETAVDGIITIDEHGIVEMINPAAERIFGYRADEVVGRNVSMLMPEPYRTEHDGYLDRYRRTGERRIIGIGREVRGRRKDGSDFPMDLAVSATDLDRRRIFTGLVRDITARKKLEQEILDIGDREQRRIGSDLHDDLCQRLAGIRFSCDALRKTLGKTQSNGVVERLERIGADVGEAIDRTRMLARGMAPVALESNGLASALQELTASVAKIFRVRCVFRGGKAIAVHDAISATHLYRIAQEGINNALKHAQPSEIAVSLARAGKQAQLTVEDDGRGFAVPEARRTSQGMGLRTIAYRAGLIEANVVVNSEPGQGTRIVCTFPSDL